MENKESNFITILAWILIIFSGLTFLMSIMQNVMLYTVFPIDDMETNINQSNDFDFVEFLFSHIRLVVGLFTLIFLFFFISSIGLLKRRKWARISLIVLFFLAIIYTLFTSVFQWLYFYDFDIPNSNLQTFEILLTVFMFVFVLGIIVLFGWLIKKLNSTKIKIEFARNQLRN